MARIGLFGSRSSHPEQEREAHDGAGERTSERDVLDRDHDHDHIGRRDESTTQTMRHDRDGDGVDDRTERHDRDGDGVDDRTERYPAVVDRDHDGVDDRKERDVAPPPAPVGSARASMIATFGMMLGLLGVVAALTGRLAPIGLALGALGLLVSFAGVVAGRKRHVAGRGLGSLGVLFSAGAIVLAVLAMTDSASWLDSDVDQVAKLRDWLDTQLPWMSDW